MSKPNLDEKYNIGNAIFQKLYNLNDSELINKLTEICYNHKNAVKILESKPKVKRIIVDGELEEIKIYNWCEVSVMYYGISFNPEHGPRTQIIYFDKFFNLNMIDDIKIDPITDSKLRVSTHEQEVISIVNGFFGVLGGDNKIQDRNLWDKSIDLAILHVDKIISEMILIHGKSIKDNDHNISFWKKVKEILIKREI